MGIAGQNFAKDEFSEFILTPKDVQTAEDARKKMADAKAQTVEESPRRVSAKANTPNKLTPFNRFQLFVLAPSAPADGDFRLVRAAAERLLHANEPIQQERSSIQTSREFVGRMSKIAQTTSSCPANLKALRALRIRPK